MGKGDPLPREVAAVWAIFLLDAVAILVTYSRLPAHELYNVSGSGLQGGLSRVLVDANFPVALAAIAVLLIAFDHVRRLRAVAVAGIVLCLPVFWPGVVDQANLDARPVNAIATVGVLVALVLSIACGFRGWSRDVRGDGYRDVVGTLAVLAALPWIFAELGFFLDGVPFLDHVFETGVYRTRGAEVAVHHGHHHGLDGLLLLLTAILLSRAVPGVRARSVRLTLAAYLSLMAAYGLGNMANDFWTEQIWKRGWTNWQFPNVLQPSLSVGWGLVVLGAALILAMSIESPHGRMGRLAERRR